MQYAASRAIASHPRLISGDRTSRLKNSIGTAWKTSEFAG